MLTMTAYAPAALIPILMEIGEIVLGSLKITLQDYIADVRINTNRVHLRSGITCELNSTHCTDIEGGDTFWDPVPRWIDHCRSFRLWRTIQWIR